MYINSKVQGSFVLGEQEHLGPVLVPLDQVRTRILPLGLSKCMNYLDETEVYLEGQKKYHIDKKIA